MGGRRHPWAAILVIVTGLSGCDNVGWGGVRVELQEPPRASGAPVEESPDSVEEVVPPLPRGPIVYLARRTDQGAELVPVVELRGDTLRSLPRLLAEEGFARRFVRERMPPGAEFVLFSRGTRVGTFHVREEPLRVDSTLCAPRPRVAGFAEVLPAAAGAERFLALAAESGGEVPREPYTVRSSTYEQRVASLNLAAGLIPEVGARWPPDLVEVRRDLQIFDLRGSSEPAIAATFLYRDVLRVGVAPEPAYSLFLVATHDGTAYRASYVWYREYDEEGKGAPRYLTHFDWDRDGADELLLEVLGESHRWFAVTGVRGGRWETLYQDPCGRPGAGGPAARE